jgi:hypothetical protein
VKYVVICAVALLLLLGTWVAIRTLRRPALTAAPAVATDVVPTAIRAATATPVPTVRPTSTPIPATPTPRAGALGDVGVLYAHSVQGGYTDVVPVANTAADLLSWNKARAPADDIGLRQMLAAFRVVPVTSGTRVRVIDTDDLDGIVQVRLLDGPFQTFTGWTDPTWIVRATPTDYVPPTAMTTRQPTGAPAR